MRLNVTRPKGLGLAIVLCALFLLNSAAALAEAAPNRQTDLLEHFGSDHGGRTGRLAIHRLPGPNRHFLPLGRSTWPEYDSPR